MVRVAQSQRTIMLFGVDIIVYNSEWRVKVIGNHSYMGLSIGWSTLFGAVTSHIKEAGRLLGPEVIGSLPMAQTVSPHWSNMSED